MSEFFRVSIIVPAYNAQKTLKECLESLIKLDYPKLEIIVVNDGSTDDTGKIAKQYDVKLIETENVGAAQATNKGIEHATGDILVSVDADASLERDWLKKIIPEFADDYVGAVAGYPVTANRTVLGRLMGYEVENRFDVAPKYVNHVYTMNTAYRKKALDDVGPFNMKMKVGYDNDMSYRLIDNGYKIVLNKDAVCHHYWRDDFRGYMKQQFKSAYYRLELQKNFRKYSDDISGAKMMIQVPVTFISILFAIFQPWLLIVPPLIQIPLTVRLLEKKRDRVVLLLPFLLSLRNVVWSLAAVKWSVDKTYKMIGEKT